MSKKEVTSQELLKATMLIKKKMELEISETLREDGPHGDSQRSGSLSEIRGSDLGPCIYVMAE